METCLARGLHTTCRLCGPSWVQWRPCRRHRGREKLLVLWPIPVLLTCGHMFDNFFLKAWCFTYFFGWCRCDGAMSSHKTLVKRFAFGPKHCMMTGGNQPTMAGTREFRASPTADDETSPCLARLAGGSISWRAHDKNERLRTRGSSFAVPCSFSWRFHLLESARQEWKTADTWFILKTNLNLKFNGGWRDSAPMMTWCGNTDV